MTKKNIKFIAVFTNLQKPFRAPNRTDNDMNLSAYKLTSRDLFSYSFMAVMHWCLVLMLVVTPAFTIVSLPVGG